LIPYTHPPGACVYVLSAIIFGTALTSTPVAAHLFLFHGPSIISPFAFSLKSFSV
jgi:hypothetical protein